MSTRMTRLYLGIDPGARGAMALMGCDADNKVAGVAVYDYVEMQKYIHILCRYVFNDHRQLEILAAVEKQQAFPGQGVATTFKLATNYGIHQGVLQAFGVPYLFCTPHKWQNKVFDSMPAKEDRKEMSLDLARRLFGKSVPLHLKKHDGRADALLIAEYLRRGGR